MENFPENPGGSMRSWRRGKKPRNGLFLTSVLVREPRVEGLGVEEPNV